MTGQVYRELAEAVWAWVLYQLRVGCGCNSEGRPAPFSAGHQGEVT